VQSEKLQSSALLAGLFTVQVVAIEAREPLPLQLLRPEEAAHLARAAPRRAGEFAAGRACARAALAQLQIEDFPLQVGPDREPLWPPGVSGSITHTEGYCGVVVAPKRLLLSLGIDAELRGAVRPALWRQICTADEQHWLQSLPELEAREMATLIFSAKEAFFKCQFYPTRQWVNFSDVSVSVETGGFEIRPHRKLKLESLTPPPWSGRFAAEQNLIVTGISLRGDLAPPGSPGSTFLPL
jgi:4'-phosphopantetheinyl transferase EntD